MWYELYTREKLRELEEERRARHSRHPAPTPSPSPFAAPLLRSAGRALRRLGESLESWGASHPEGKADVETA